MATYGLKHYGENTADNGRLLRVEIAERGYVGAATGHRLMDSWIQAQGPSRDAVYAPILKTKGAIVLEDRADTIQNDLLHAEDGQYQITFLEDGNVIGRMEAIPLKDRRSLNLGDLDTEVRGRCGLASLDDIAFLDANDAFFEGLISWKDIIATCLGKLDLGLDMYMALEWHAKQVTSSQRPLEQYSVDAEMFIDDEGYPRSCADVLTEALETFHLQVRQSAGAWHVVERSLLFAGSYDRARYDAAGTFIAEETYDPAVAIGEEAAAEIRKRTPDQPTILPYKAVSAVYGHGELPALIRQPTFADTIERRGRSPEDVADRGPREGSGGDGSGGRGPGIGRGGRGGRGRDRDRRRSLSRGRRRTGTEVTSEVWFDELGGSGFTVQRNGGPDGESTLSLPIEYSELPYSQAYGTYGNYNVNDNGGENPRAWWNHVAKYVGQKGLFVIPDTGRKLRISLATMVKLLHEDVKERYAVPVPFELRLTNPDPDVSNQYLKRDKSTGETVWSTTRTSVPMGRQIAPRTPHAQDHWTDHPYLVPVNRWNTDVYLTPDLPAIPSAASLQAWQVEIYLYQTQFDVDDQGALDEHLWTNIHVDLSSDQGRPKAYSVTAYEEGSTNKLREEYETPFGLPPILGGVTGAIVMPSGDPATSYKDAPHSTTDGLDPTEKLAQELFLEQAEACKIHDAGYLRQLPRIWPHQVLELDGVRYQVGGVEYGLPRSTQEGQYIELKQFSAAPTFDAYAEESGFTAFGGSTGERFTEAFIKNDDALLNQALQNAIGKTSAVVSGAVSTLPMAVLSTPVEAGDGLVLITPQGEHYEFFAAANRNEGAADLAIEDENGNPFDFGSAVPAPSGIHASQGDLKNTLIQTKNSLQSSIQVDSVASATADALAGATSIPTGGGTNLTLKDGDRLVYQQNEDSGEVYGTVNLSGEAAADLDANGNWAPGKTYIPVEALPQDVPSGARLHLSAETFQSDIEQFADEIELRVREDEIISSINVSPETIRIDSDLIQLTGDTTVAGDFEVTGGNIVGGLLQSTNYGTSAGSLYDLDLGTIELGGSSAPKLYVDELGNLTAADAVFDSVITKNGKFDGLVPTGDVIISDDYLAGSYGFIIRGDGTVEFEDAIVRGTIYATDGEFEGDLTGVAMALSGNLDVLGEVSAGNIKLTPSGLAMPSGSSTDSVITWGAEGEIWSQDGLRMNISHDTLLLLGQGSGSTAHSIQLLRDSTNAINKMALNNTDVLQIPVIARPTGTPDDGHIWLWAEQVDAGTQKLFWREDSPSGGQTYDITS